MKKYFSIGETARINQVPIKTLRYYDEVGVLTPAFTNSQTGYRYYSPEQFYLIDIIKYGKRLDLSLEEIQRLMADQDLDGQMKMLRTQKEQAQAKIRVLQSMIHDIDSTLENMAYVQICSDAPAPYFRKKKGGAIAYVMTEKPDMVEADVQLRKIMSSPRLQPYLTYKYGYFLSVAGLRQGKIDVHGEYIRLNRRPDFDNGQIRHVASAVCACFQCPLFSPDADAGAIADYAQTHECKREYILADEIFYSPVWEDNVYELCFPTGRDVASAPLPR